MIIRFFVIGFILCGCTVLSIAPRPDLSIVQYKRGNALEGKKINVLVNDQRKKNEHSKELATIFKSVLEKQIKLQKGEVSENGNPLVFELKSYDIANSNTGCTVIISYKASYLSLSKSSIVTKDFFPCVDAESKSLLASNAISKMLKEMDAWLESIVR